MCVGILQYFSLKVLVQILLDLVANNCSQVAGINEKMKCTVNRLCAK